MTGDENHAKAEQVLAEAARLPSAEEVRVLAGRAAARGRTRDMSLDEIRALGDRAVAGAREVAVLMCRLSELVEVPVQPGGRGGDW